MNLREVQTLITELEVRIEEFQKFTSHLNLQMVKLQLQAEQITKKTERLSEWATGSSPNISNGHQNNNHLR